MRCSWAQLHLEHRQRYSVHDVIAQKQTGTAQGAYTAVVERHDVGGLIVLAPEEGGIS